jgi:hypothetical protein
MRLFLALLLAGCGSPSSTLDLGGTDATDGAVDAARPTPADADDVTPDVGPDGGAPAPDLAGVDAAMIVVGGQARTIGALHLRNGPGTQNAILLTMPCGALVDVVGGPTTGWWNVTFMGTTGWASGLYLVAATAFDPSVCGTDGGAAAYDGGIIDQASIFALAKLGVGYSYYWGHGSWRADGTLQGACFGTCPGCTHSGSYGADCSGFVAKCWQVPSPSPIETDLHPYSTYDFYNFTYHWSPVPRSSIQPADALTYNANGAGHIMLFESGADPWGNIWTYEARGCATGIVHNLRVAGSEYIAIRRAGL